MKSGLVGAVAVGFSIIARTMSSNSRADPTAAIRAVRIRRGHDFPMKTVLMTMAAVLAAVCGFGETNGRLVYDVPAGQAVTNLTDLSESVTEIVKTGPGELVLGGNNEAFAGTLSVRGGTCRFLVRKWFFSPTGGEKATIVATGARLILDQTPNGAKGPFADFEYGVKSAMTLADGAVFETLLDQSVVLWGKVTSEGARSSIVSAHHLTFGHEVKMSGGGIAFAMTEAASKEGRAFTFSGGKVVSDAALEVVRGDVYLNSVAQTKDGVRLGDGKLVARLLARAPGGAFVVGDKVQFIRTCADAAPDGTAYSVENWKGERVTSGTWSAGEILTLPVSERGYYRLKLANGTRVTFAIVSGAEGRLPNEDSPFGIGENPRRYRTWDCPWYPGGRTDRLSVELLARAGIPWVRLSVWFDGVGKDGRWDPAERVDKFRQLKERGINMNIIGECASKVMKNMTDLRGIYEEWASLGRAASPYTRNFEYRNEQEIVSLGSWNTVAEAKAASLGLKSVLPDALLASPSHTRFWRTRYDDAIYENDLAKYTDVLNYHYYNSLARIPTVEREMRSQVGKFGLFDREEWVTETGTNGEGNGWEKDEGRWDRFARHAWEQELGVAEWVMKSQGLMAMMGVRRTFNFCFGPCNERKNQKSWAICLRRDGTVKPGYAAFSTMIDELGKAKLVEEILLNGESAPARAYVYRQPDGTKTLAFWTVTELETHLGGHNTLVKPTEERKACTVNVPDGEYRLTDMCGSSRTVKAVGGKLQLVATRFPQYLSGIKTLEAWPMQPAGWGRAGVIPAAADEDRTLVYRATPDRRDFRVAVDIAYQAKLTNATGRVTFELWNLSDKAKKGRYALLSGKFKGLPDGEITLPPMGKASFVGVFDRRDFKPGEEMNVRLGGTFDGRRPTAFAMPLVIQ